jgi:GntR family transcriptional regulator/MocR family aminotransferase
VPVQWAGLPPPVLLDLARGTGRPLRAQLEGGLRDAIRGGRLPIGERLPSSRELARQLGVSRGLVQDCYGQLVAEGYLTSLVGSGTRVATGAWSAVAHRSSVAPRPTLRVDFESGVPDLGSFPREDWAWAVREACRTIPSADLSYGDRRGSARLREVLAGYLRRVRAAAADPENIVVCTGFAQGFALVVRVLTRAGGGRVALEDPGYGDPELSVSSKTVRRAGAQLVHVPVDERGIDVDALQASGARVVVVTPAHQSPTGVVLAADRRHALVRWADRNDGYILEDDYDSEFRYDREPIGVLQGLAPERVFAVGTTSKSLAPTVRLGWVLAPPGLVGALGEEKQLDDRGTPGLDQLALAALLESGRYDRHLRRMRASYARRRSALVDSLARHAPGVRLTGLAAGFHAVAHLSDDADERAVVAAALARRIGLYGMALFRADGRATPPQLVFGFGNVGERAIEDGIATVGDLLR